MPATPPAATGPRRVVSGQVYSYIKDGVRHYTSTRPQGGTQVASLRTIKYSYIETCFACGNPGVDFGRLRLNTSAYAAEIAAASREFGVEESILRAIMHAESSYNPMALSHAGAQGLMQLMPATAADLGVDRPFGVVENIDGGVRYLRAMLDRFGDVARALAAYNAGPGRVRQLRREAAARKLDENTWFNNVERIANERIGRETVTYVSNIYKYYVSYLLIQGEYIQRRTMMKKQ